MRLGWRTPRVDGLKLVNYTRIEDAHKVRKKIVVFKKPIKNKRTLKIPLLIFPLKNVL